MLEKLKFWKKKEPSKEKDILFSLDQEEDIRGQLDSLMRAIREHHKAMKEQHKDILDLREKKQQIQKNIKEKTFDLIKKRIEEGKEKREVVEEVIEKTGYCESSAYKFIKEVKKKRLKRKKKPKKKHPERYNL